MKLTRRDFLKVAGFTGSAAFLTSRTLLKGDDNLVDESDRPYDQWRTDFDANWGMVIDLARCDGCVDIPVPRCTQACITGHYTPDDHLYIKVFEMAKEDGEPTHFFPRPCQQCLDPPCVHVCPVSSAWQRDGDRLTLIDNDRCIGCRLCMAACPYEVRFFHWEENPKGKDIPDGDYESQMPFTMIRDRGVVAKCEFCGLQFIGKLPHCISACHKGALYFGNILENAMTNTFNETILLDETLKKRAGFIWKEEENTKPRVFYLPATGEE
ncbi:MAG: 4Fe-4S dicluster domain-containing protein [Candidatus Heimdallarchaeota archaeon]